MSAISVDDVDPDQQQVILGALSAYDGPATADDLVDRYSGLLCGSDDRTEVIAEIDAVLEHLYGHDVIEPVPEDDHLQILQAMHNESIAYQIREIPYAADNEPEPTTPHHDMTNEERDQWIKDKYGFEPV